MSVDKTEVERARKLLEAEFDLSPLTWKEMWYEGRVDIEDAIPYIEENLISKNWKEIAESGSFPVLDYFWFDVPPAGMAKVIAACAYGMVVHGPDDLWEFMDRMSSGFCGVLGRNPSLLDWRERLTVAQMATLAEVFSIACELHGAVASEEDRWHMASLANCMKMKSLSSS